MTITYSAADPNYDADRYAVLTYFEDNFLDVYADQKGLATIGVGFLVSDNTDVILRNMGLSDAQIIAAVPAIQAATKGISFSSDQAALDAINKALRDSTNNQSLNFGYTSDTQIEQTFKDIKQRYN